MFGWNENEKWPAGLFRLSLGIYYDHLYAIVVPFDQFAVALLNIIRISLI